MRIYGISGVSTPQMGLAAALTYWVFQCRDRARTPANGVKTWEYLQSSIKNAAIPARTIEDYLQNLSKRLIVPSLRPQALVKIFDPAQIVMRATVNPDGSVGEFQEISADQGILRWQSWEDILQNDLAPKGITAKHILSICQRQPNIVVVFTRLRFEEDRSLSTNDEEFIDV